MADYVPYRSQPISVRKPVSAPPPPPAFVLPDTPPATPPTFHKSAFESLSRLEDGIGHGYASHASASAMAQHSGQSGHRRGRQSITEHHHFITTMPSPTDSPLALPTLLSDDEDVSPSGSTGILTPPMINVSADPAIISEHSMLHALALGGETPPALHLDTNCDRRGGFPPLLSPHYTRKPSRQLSPPTTPKGHPISAFPSRKRLILPFQKDHPISQPSLWRKITYLCRVPRRYRPTIILALCAFTFAALYLSRAMSMAHELQVTHTRLHPISPGQSHVPVLTDEQRARLAAMQKEHVRRSAAVKPLEFQSLEEEFAAVMSYITATNNNLLPQIDASQPINPSLILDFDPTSPRAREDLELIKTEVHAMYPLIVFGKMRDPWHREVTKMLSEYKIFPPPIIVELDQRPDSATFIPLLARLLGTQELPQVTLQGQKIGSYHEFLALREKGTLKATLEKGGVMKVKEAKKLKKQKKAELEKLEMEKVLAPRPIVDGQ